MFTKTYEIMAPYPGELNAVLAHAAIELVEGETLQIQAPRQGALDRDTYLEIIAKKTAALFVACVELGALAADARPEWTGALKQYAFNLGLAFQITDDVLDLIADPEQVGKNVGIDLSQGRGFAAVKDGHHNRGGNGSALEIAPDTAPGPLKESFLSDQSLDMAVRKGREKAEELANLAITSLDLLPPSAAADELRALARHMIERDH